MKRRSFNKHEDKAGNTSFLHASAPYVQSWTMVLQSSHSIREARASLYEEIPSPQLLKTGVEKS